MSEKVTNQTQELEEKQGLRNLIAYVEICTMLVVGVLSFVSALYLLFY